MCLLVKRYLVLAILSTMLVNQLSAYCARCTKIEEERTKEETEHPHHLGYYDDQIHLHESEKGSLKEESRESPAFTDHSNAQKSLLLSMSGEDFFEEETFNTSDAKKQSIAKPDNSKTENFFYDTNDRKFNEHTHSTIFNILETKNLLSALTGPFTLFVPTNEALARLPSSSLQLLLRPDQEDKLDFIISNHVVTRKLLKEDFKKFRGKEVKSMSGHNLTLDSKNGELTIDGARIIRIEPIGNDGIVYIIDGVLGL